MMSRTLALQFLSIFCFTFLGAMHPQGFGQQPPHFAPGAYPMFPTYPIQPAMPYGAYPPYGMPMMAPHPYMYPAPMFPHQDSYKYMAPYPVPAYAAPQQSVPRSFSQPSLQPVRSDSCNSASLRANSRNWDNTTRSISASTVIPQVIQPKVTDYDVPLAEVPKVGVEIAAVPAGVEPTETKTVETQAAPVPEIVIESKKEAKKAAPVSPVGNKSAAAPKKLAPLSPLKKTTTSAAAPKKPATKSNHSKAYVPKQYVPKAAPAAPEPVVETKTSNPWAAKGISQKIRNKNFMPIEAHVRHIIYYLDRDQYKRAYAAGTDPRDLAFAYIMIGQRLWNNVLYPLAQSLGTDYTAMLCHDLNAFEKAFFAPESARQNAAMDATFIEDLNLNDVRNAISMYRNRLRICHPKQFPRKFKGNQDEARINHSVLMTHFDYLYKWTGKNQAETSAKSLETGYSINSQMVSLLEQRAHVTEDEAKQLGQQAYFGGNRVGKVDDQMVPFAKEGEVDATLALLYIWDHCRPTGNTATFHSLRKTRNQMAHQEGSDEMYQAYVNAIFSGPSQSGLQELLLACGRMEDLGYEVQQYVVDESVQYDNDCEIEVIEDTN